MKTFVCCCLVAAFAALASAQLAYPTIKPLSFSPTNTNTYSSSYSPTTTTTTNYRILNNTIAAIHSALSTTPLAIFLPPPEQVAAEVINTLGPVRPAPRSGKTRSTEVSEDFFGVTVTIYFRMIQEAANQVHFPPEALFQITQQVLQPAFPTQNADSVPE